MNNKLVCEQRLDIIKKLFIYFLLYSVFGWCYEVFLEVVIYQWGFTNRGVLFGPYCPVYGVGALMFIICFYKFVKKPYTGIMKYLKPVLVFLLCMLAATLLELLTSYILEFLTGSWPWQTYADYKINFQARIALSPSLRFGLGGLLFLYILQPIFEKLTAKLTPKALNIITIILAIIFITDLMITIL